jgi:hypothetical protein
MKKKAHRGAWRFAVLYALLLLVMFSATTVILLRALRKSADEPPQTETEEIYVYLPQEERESETETPPESESERYVVKEYHGQIGIFSSDGTLLEILDTYVKTLPDADRALLGEGIWVETREALNALIEDYSH